MDTFTLGRSQADIILDDPSVSKRHAELTVSEDATSYYLVDCGSSNGTYVQRSGIWEKISQTTVQSDDVVRFGSNKVRMRELVKRLPKREPNRTALVEPPVLKTVLQPFRNAETGEIEYR